MAVLRRWRVHPVIIAGAPRDLPAARSLRYRLSVPVVGVYVGVLVMLMLLRSDLWWGRIVCRRELLLMLWLMLRVWMCMRMLMCMVRMGRRMGVASAWHARHDKIYE